MYNVSNGFKEAIASTSRLLSYSVLVDDRVIPSENIISLELSDSINNGDTFSIGRTITNTLNLKLSNIGGFVSNQIVKPSLAIEVQNDGKVSVEYVPLGVFYIIEIEENKGEVTLSCYDKMSFLDEEYIPTVSQNPTLAVVVDDICNQSGITFEGNLRNIMLEGSITGYSFREMLGFIASLEGGNAKFDRNGTLIIKKYEAVNAKITPKNYSDFSFTELYSITGVAAQFGDVANNRGDSTGHCVTFINPFVTDSNIDEIYRRLKGLKFVPSTIEYRGDFSIDAGDIVTIEDLNGDEYLLLISQNNLSFSGGLTGRISSIGENKSTNEVKEYKFKNKKSLTELNIKLGQIQGVVQEVEKSQNDLDERIKKAELEITAESIVAKVEDIFVEKDELNNYSTTQQVDSAIKVAQDSITQTVSENFYSKNEFANSSVLNLIMNGGFENGAEHWERNGDFTDSKDIWFPHDSGTSWVIWADRHSGFYQRFSCIIGKTYSWSADVYIEAGCGNIGIEGLTSRYWYEGGWTKISGTFTATSTIHTFIIYGDYDATTIIHIDNIMVCEGAIPHPYQPNYIDINSRLRLAEQKITPDAIVNTVRHEVYTKSETEDVINNKGYATQAQVTHTAEQVEYRFSQSGGYNLIRNGGFENGITHWSLNNSPNIIENQNWQNYDGKSIWVSATTFGSGIFQFFPTTIGKVYSYSLYAQAEYGEWWVGIENAHTQNIAISPNNWIRYTGTFTATSDSHAFICYSFGDGRNVFLDNIMICEGVLPSAYTPHPSEVYEEIIKMDKDGLMVSHGDSYSRLDARGLMRYDGDNGKYYHYLSYMGQVDLASEERATIQLPMEFKNRDFKVIVSVKRVRMNYDPYTEKHLLMGFYAEVNSVDTSNATFEVYASVRAIKSTNFNGTITGADYGHDIVRPVVAYWVYA